MAGNRFGDIRFGDINVSLTGSQATPQAAGGGIVEQTRREMMSMLSDL
jgi:hypothetical protein